MMQLMNIFKHQIHQNHTRFRWGTFLGIDQRNFG